MAHNDTVRHIKDKPHSFEFGKAGQRVKLYFDTVPQLKSMLQGMFDWGFIEEMPNFNKKGVESDGKQNKP